jgi:flavin reductase (DIM6/NTAB) family NADH-FMN oxidoreductase RutF
LHLRSESPILYFGTPVVLISTVNEDGSYNLAPMSSAWWLGWRCMLGLAASSKTTENLLRTGECVLNLPSADQADCVNAIARTTGSSPVPLSKARRGYSTLREKFQAAGLTPTPSEIVAAPRALECPVQMEASLAEAHPVAADAPVLAGFALKIEVSIERLHIDAGITMNGNPNRVDPDKWRPLIMSFQQFYGLKSQKLHHSRLGEIPEEAYPRVGGERSGGGALIELPKSA